jgi:D-inositol-3-phosphate glycosyltransferase
MKILYSCLSKSWGGMEMFTITAVKQLLKRNIKVELLCCEESRIHIEANNLGLIIHTVKPAGIIHPFASLKLSSILSKGNFDLIHTQASKDLWIIVPALKLIGSKIPLFLTKQIGSFINKKDKLHKMIYERVTFAFAISNVIKDNLLKTTPLPENKILLLHNGIDIDEFNPEKVSGKTIRKEFNVNDDEILIGMLARFSPGKGHEEFLNAAEDLSKKFSNLKFMIVGEASRGEDDYADKIKALAVKRNLNNVIFTGFRSDTSEILAAMDIFIFPSHSEAFGIALAEAMSMGKPSVCSNSDGILDVAVDKKTSFFFEVKSSKDLSEKISLLIESPSLRAEFGAAARERAINNFDIKKLTEDAISVYQNSLRNV